MRSTGPLKTALVHHWLVTMRGGESVLQAMAELFPDADIFTLLCDRTRISPELRAHRIHTSFLQHVPPLGRWYRYFLPLFPYATERLNLSGCDLIINSDAATMKGIRIDPGAIHICYCHTPMRYVWGGFETYMQSSGPVTRLGLRAVAEPLRRWDYRAAQGVTQFVANSQNVVRQIKRIYGRDSVVIYPPVDAEAFCLAPTRAREDFYLVVSSLVPYKRVDLIVEAFNHWGRQLVVIGEGIERQKLERRARSNIRFLGPQPQEVVVRHMQTCKAFVFGGEEDFGIVMAEAQACGAPVVAFSLGGAAEIVADGLTGILFERQTQKVLLEGLERVESARFDPEAARASALRFKRERFLQEFSELVNDVLGNAQGASSRPASFLTPEEAREEELLQKIPLA